jgi:hypothetical protein
MKVILPIFPLQIVVFPEERLNLHIFEPRYIQLIQDLEISNTTFGIPPIIDSSMMAVGTEVTLLEIVKKYENGRMDIRCQGLGPYRSLKFLNYVQDKLYSGSEIERIDFEMVGEYSKNEEILRMLRSMYIELNIKKSLPEPLMHGLSFQLGHQIGLQLNQELELLKMPLEVSRQDYIIEHLKNFIPNTTERIELRKRALMNGQFRKIGQGPGEK